MTRMKLWSIAIVMAVAALAVAPRAQQAAAQPRRPFRPSWRSIARCRSMRRSRPAGLPNGIRYYIRQNGRPEKRVSMRLAVDAGSIQEEDNQRGLAHFLEHMAFNGSENFKPGELVSFLESIGARFGPHVNASTSFDETIYMLDVPADRPGYVDKGLLILRDFAAGISFIPEEVEKERGVVLEEWRGRLGANSRLIDKQLPVIFQGSRYADRLPIGLPDVLKSAPRERLLAFYQKWYRTDRMAVVVVGDIAPDEAERLIQQRFGGIPTASGAAPATDRAVPSHRETLVSMSTDAEAQGWTVTIGFKRAAEEDETVRGYRKSLVEQLVSEMLNLRFREIARRPNAPFLAAQAGADGIGRVLELFELNAAVPAGQLAPGLETLLFEARRMQQFGFSADELDRARRTLLAGYERRYKERSTAESPSYANEYVRNFLQHEPAPGIEFEYRIAATYLPTVTSDEVTALARTLITDDNRVVLAVAPENKDVPAPTVDALKTAMARAGSAPVERWAEATAGRELVEKPPAPGKVTARRTIRGAGRDRAHAVQRRRGLVEADRLQERSGAVHRLRAGRHVTGARSRLQERQPGHRDGGRRWHGWLESRGSEQDAVGENRPGVAERRRVHPRRQRLQHAEGSGNRAAVELPVVHGAEHDAGNASSCSSGAWPERSRTARRTRARSSANRSRLVNSSNHYSAVALKAADVPGLSLEAMRAFYGARFGNAADFTYFFVGAFSVDEVTPLIEKWLASLPSTGKRTANFRDMGVRFPARVVSDEVHKGKEPASQTVLSFFADPGLDELEMHRVRAAASVLGIRLREILREELGGTYGVQVGFDSPLPYKGYGAMVIQFGSSPENVDKLVKAALAEVERLKTQGPSVDDVNKVKELERRDLETNAKQNSYWLGSLQTVHMLGWDPTGILRRSERTEKLSPEVLQPIFRKYFPTDRYTLVTLKPEA